MVDLPMSKIKESLPRMTYYDHSGDRSGNLPREINGVQVIRRTAGSKQSTESGRRQKRTMSASSANSQRSFRATRKRPSVIDGPSDSEIR